MLTCCRCQEAVAQLQHRFPDATVDGCAADVARSEDCERLADYAAAVLGGVDVWIQCACVVT